jgi:acyl-CoA oxidase
MPVSGVKVGDLGPKMGYNSVDNGWLSFDQLRIPRTGLLSRFGEVNKKGEFTAKGDPKMLFNAMV